jgi:FPC/CPF motif-containing protein YcgG
MTDENNYEDETYLEGDFEDEDMTHEPIETEEYPEDIQVGSEIPLVSFCPLGERLFTLRICKYPMQSYTDMTLSFFWGALYIDTR